MIDILHEKGDQLPTLTVIILSWESIVMGFFYGEGCTTVHVGFRIIENHMDSVQFTTCNETWEQFY